MKPPVAEPPTLPSLRVAASLGLVIGGTIAWGLVALCLGFYSLGYAGGPKPVWLQRVGDVLIAGGPALFYFPALLCLWRKWLFSTRPDLFKTLGITLAAGLIVCAVPGTKPPQFDLRFVLGNFLIAPIALLACMWGASPRILPPEPSPPFVPHCPECRYDLRGQRECRCPECGREFALGELRG